MSEEFVARSALDCPPCLANPIAGSDSSANMFRFNEFPTRFHELSLSTCWRSRIFHEPIQSWICSGFCAGGRKRPKLSGKRRRRKSDAELLRRQTTRSRHRNLRRRRPRKPRYRRAAGMPGAEHRRRRSWENPVRDSGMAGENCVPGVSRTPRKRGHDPLILKMTPFLKGYRRSFAFCLMQSGCAVCSIP